MIIKNTASKIKPLLFIFLFSINEAFPQEILTTIPQVQKWTSANKSTTFNQVTIQYSDAADANIQALLSQFEQELTAIGVKVNQRASKSSIVLHFNTNTLTNSPHTDYYEIELAKKTHISASSYKGILFATRTLLQIFSQKKYQDEFPNGHIVDYPTYQKRMLLIDVARKFFTLAELKDYIRTMAWLKMNELHLHLSDNSWGGYSAYRLESKKYPQLTAKDGHYSWKEIRELQDFAHKYGITITPEIDSPGHSLAFTKIRPDLKSSLLTENYLDITNKDTYLFMEEILNEVIPHFDAADFHLGTDEYRIGSIKDPALKLKIGETFRKYINHFNKVVRKHGKITRIWSGFEHMPGTTKIDNNITIDMWETADAKDKSLRGFKIINSSHFYTYIVPGAPYYGVDNQYIYESWTPEIFSDKADQNLNKGSAGLQGGKLHIWNDFGPGGYSIEEISRLSIPSMMIFSEKLWGTKGFDSVLEFNALMNHLIKVPQTKLLQRLFSKEELLYSSKNLITLKNKSFHKINSKKLNAEYPWELQLTLNKTSKSDKNEVLLSSDLASIYSNLEYTFKTETKDGVVEKNKRGLAIVRANQTQGETPLTSHTPQVIVFDYQLPVNQAVKIRLLGEKGKTSLYVNGKLIGTENLQMLCPLEFIGSKKEASFQGVIKQINLKELGVDVAQELLIK